MLHFLVYVSSATALFTHEQLDELLSQCRANNERLEITGMLLYKDGNVMQYLEGEEWTLRALYDRIDADPRHHGVITVWSGYTAEREFTDWSMAYRDLGDPVVTERPGYSQFLNTPLTAGAFAGRPSLCQQLFTLFKQS